MSIFVQHWSYAVYLFCGAVLIGIALIGKRFFAGISTGAKANLGAWQGRFWLIIAGIFLISTGLIILLPGSTTVEWINKLSVVASNGYEVFVAGIVGAVGIVFLFADRDGWRSKGRLIGAVLLVMSIFTLWDGIWKLRH